MDWVVEDPTKTVTGYYGFDGQMWRWRALGLGYLNPTMPLNGYFPVLLQEYRAREALWPDGWRP